MGSVALGQQGIPQQLMRGSKIRIEFQSLIQRRNRSAKVTVLQIRLTQSHKASSGCRFELSHFLEFHNRRGEVPTLLGFGAGLEVLQGFRSGELPGEEQQ